MLGTNGGREGRSYEVKSVIVATERSCVARRNYGKGEEHNVRLE